MEGGPAQGHDGPYAAPLPLPGGEVEPGWIDYNGHMNVAWYMLAFDRAIDVMLERELGLGETHVHASGQGPFALQSSIHYLAELRLAARFRFEALLLDADAKRMHLVVTMVRASDGSPAATLETLLMNVDHATRRAVPYPDWAQPRLARMLADHATAPRPPQAGRPLGIRRQG
ncbi:thioesterase [Halovulum dunhuangense]|uniref:Thioesterase n=1 Tax=Halovulum dunhuangense TaxID=1505036 RepID=A0A849L183_9RHOB|nr:thioesterase family protein [Halovulum dunhuangense]NNU80023.1 thioesterase [Halovulum dunhuangense]